MCKICGRRPCPKHCPGEIAEEITFRCPCCEAELSTGDFIYAAGEDIVGCENCITRKFVRDAESLSAISAS